MKYRIPTALATIAGCTLAAHALAQGVKPPPLPPASAKVRVVAGMSEPEKQRQIRAHHHKGHHRKDHTRDDSIPAPAGRRN